MQIGMAREPRLNVPWDFSVVPPRASKWWTVTTGELTRQAQTARNIRRKGRDVGHAGLAVQLSMPPKDFSPDDTAALRTFIERHGQPIQHHLDGAQTVGDDLRLAWAYRAALAGEPGAWSTWVRLIRPAA